MYLVQFRLVNMQMNILLIPKSTVKRLSFSILSSSLGTVFNLGTWFSLSPLNSYFVNPFPVAFLLLCHMSFQLQNSSKVA